MKKGTTTKKKVAALAAGAAATVPPSHTDSSDNESESLESASSISILKSLAAKFTKFEIKIDKMEAQLSAALADNKKLKAELVEKGKVIEEMQKSYSNLELKINSLEQYNRAWSVRVTNIPLTNEEEKSPLLLREKVYKLAFRPILEGAIEAGKIHNIPAASELLELAHVLPGKPGQHKPIIARFRDRILKTICLRLKKTYATRSTGQANGSGGGGTGSARDGTGRVVKGDGLHSPSTRTSPLSHTRK